MIDLARVRELLDRVKDPEIPVISVLEPGVVRDVAVEALTFTAWRSNWTSPSRSC